MKRPMYFSSHLLLNSIQRRARRIGCLLFLCVIDETTLSAAPTPQWDFSRNMLDIYVPQAVCGGGSPYRYFFSLAGDAPSNQGNPYTLTVLFEGGGSSFKRPPDGATPQPPKLKIKTLADIRSLLHVESGGDDPSGDNNVFAQMPENWEFISKSNWLYLPYCTQDNHRGERTDPETYRLPTSILDGIPSALQYLQGTGIVMNDCQDARDELELAHGGLRLTVNNPAATNLSSCQFSDPKVEIIHGGAHTAQAAIDMFIGQLQQIRPDFLQKAQILVIGHSAGGKGAWYNLHRFGDILPWTDENRLTLSSWAAMPRERKWIGQQQDIVPDWGSMVEEDFKVNFYQARRVCEVQGGAFAGYHQQCDDVLDLHYHYQSERYPGKDVYYLPQTNKEDRLTVGGIEGDAQRGIAQGQLSPSTAELTFREDVLGLCKTQHRYGQYLAARPNTAPYVKWNFRNVPKPSGSLLLDDANLEHIHVPNYAHARAQMFAPSGRIDASGNAIHGLGLLDFVNKGALRQLPQDIWDFPLIEHVPHYPEGTGPYDNYEDYTLKYYEDHYNLFHECNVPEP